MAGDVPLKFIMMLFAMFYSIATVDWLNYVLIVHSNFMSPTRE